MPEIFRPERGNMRTLAQRKPRRHLLTAVVIVSTVGLVALGAEAASAAGAPPTDTNSSGRFSSHPTPPRSPRPTLPGRPTGRPTFHPPAPPVQFPLPEGSPTPGDGFRIQSVFRVAIGTQTYTCAAAADGTGAWSTSSTPEAILVR